MNKALDLENRKKIYRFILEHPGVNLSRIAELLKMNVPLVDYHTLQLEDDGLISIVKEGGFKRYFVSGKTGERDKRFLGVLRQETPLKIVLFLLDNPYSKHKEILKNFDIRGSSLTYHLNKLVKSGIVHHIKSSEKKGYVIPDEKGVYRFLIRYRPSTTLKRMKETWGDDFRIL